MGSLMDPETSTGKLRRTIARGLALLAIAAAGVALVVVVSDSLSDSGDGGRDGKRARHDRTQTQSPEEETYVVQPNDTLTGIAQETGVSLKKLQRFNCNIDPQALPAGATLQLREPAPDCDGSPSG
jgi:LysM repeat protein